MTRPKRHTAERNAAAVILVIVVALAAAGIAPMAAAAFAGICAAALQGTTHGYDTLRPYVDHLEHDLSVLQARREDAA